MRFNFFRRTPVITTGNIKSIFEAELAAAGGTVANTYHGRKGLFIRSVLPYAQEVLPGDGLQGSVALRSNGADTWVHPYIFRRICSNGLIVARAVAGEHIAVPVLNKKDEERREEFYCQLRQAITACSRRENFFYALERMKAASEMRIDRDLKLLSFLHRIPRIRRGLVVNLIMRRFHQDGERSRFTLTNAVTSVARDTRDPQLKWQLEMLGGKIGVLAVSVARRQTAAA